MDNKSINLLFVLLVFICSFVTLDAASGKFYAAGTSEPIVKYLQKPSSPVPRELRKVAVEVHFDLVPTMMRFSMPCYPCMVTENDIHFSNGWTETYDPKASSSCEVLWDNEARHTRMWIESQNPARIVVRWRWISRPCRENSPHRHSERFALRQGRLDRRVVLYLSRWHAHTPCPDLYGPGRAEPFGNGRDLRRNPAHS